MWIKVVAWKCFNLLKRMTHKILFKIKLWEMDSWWEFIGGSCWQLFPPSFFYTHSEEEIEVIIEETVERISRMIDEL